MPLIIPKDLPAKSVLAGERIFLMDQERAYSQDIRPLKVAILNLMPKKEETETQFLRMLSNTSLQLEFDLIRTKTYTGKHTSASHLQRFYKTFDEIKEKRYDAMIVTGAPIEKLDYEDVLYWDELSEIFDYIRENVFSTVFVCWASQAALYYYYDIPKHTLPEKIFGVYESRLEKKAPLTKGFDDYFFMPQSRYTLVNREDVEKISDLEIYAARDDIGTVLTASKDGRFIFVAGHGEYDTDTLYNEYIRDKKAGLATKLPVNYFQDDDPEKPVISRWKSSANLFYVNWLNYCVYQNTPYDLRQMKGKSVSKIGSSLLSDAERFAELKNLIAKEDDREIIVVSAPGKRNPHDEKVVDSLIKLCSLKSQASDTKKLLRSLSGTLEENKRKSDAVMMKVAKRYYEIIEDLGLPDSVLKTIQETLCQISNSFDRDFIISRGEYLNAVLLSSYLNYDFIDAKDIIIFNPDGSFNFEKSREKIRQRLTHNKKFVIPGYYGADESGNLHSFSRDEPDRSARIIADALNSELNLNITENLSACSKEESSTDALKFDGAFIRRKASDKKAPQS